MQDLESINDNIINYPDRMKSAIEITKIAKELDLSNDQLTNQEKITFKDTLEQMLKKFPELKNHKF